MDLVDDFGGDKKASRGAQLAAGKKDKVIAGSLRKSPILRKSIANKLFTAASSPMLETASSSEWSRGAREDERSGQGGGLDIGRRLLVLVDKPEEEEDSTELVPGRSRKTVHVVDHGRCQKEAVRRLFDTATQLQSCEDQLREAEKENQDLNEQLNAMKIRLQEFGVADAATLEREEKERKADKLKAREKEKEARKQIVAARGDEIKAQVAQRAAEAASEALQQKQEDYTRLKKDLDRVMDDRKELKERLKQVEKTNKELQSVKDQMSHEAYQQKKNMAKARALTYPKVPPIAPLPPYGRNKVELPPSKLDEEDPEAMLNDLMKDLPNSEAESESSEDNILQPQRRASQMPGMVCSKCGGGLGSADHRPSMSLHGSHGAGDPADKEELERLRLDLESALERIEDLKEQLETLEKDNQVARDAKARYQAELNTARKELAQANKKAETAPPEVVAEKEAQVQQLHQASEQQRQELEQLRAQVQQAKVQQEAAVQQAVAKAKEEVADDMSNAPKRGAHLRSKVAGGGGKGGSGAVLGGGGGGARGGGGGGATEIGDDDDFLGDYDVDEDFRQELIRAVNERIRKILAIDWSTFKGAPPFGLDADNMPRSAQEVKKLEEELAQARKKLAEAHEESEQLKDQLNSKVLAIKSLTSNKSGAAKEMQEQIDKLEAQLQARDEQCQKLQAEMKTKEAEWMEAAKAKESTAAAAKSSQEQAQALKVKEQAAEKAAKEASQETTKETNKLKNALRRSQVCLHLALARVCNYKGIKMSRAQKAVNDLLEKDKESDPSGSGGGSAASRMQAVEHFEEWTKECTSALERALSKGKEDLNQAQQTCAEQKDEISRLLLVVDELRRRLELVASSAANAQPGSGGNAVDDIFTSAGLGALMQGQKFKDVFERLYGDAFQRLQRLKLLQDQMVAARKACSYRLAEDKRGLEEDESNLENLRLNTEAALKDMRYHTDILFKEACDYVVSRGIENAFAQYLPGACANPNEPRDLALHSSPLSSPYMSRRLGGGTPKRTTVQPWEEDIEPRLRRKDKLMGAEPKSFASYMDALREGQGEVPKFLHEKRIERKSPNAMAQTLGAFAHQPKPGSLGTSHSLPALSKNRNAICQA